MGRVKILRTLLFAGGVVLLIFLVIRIGTGPIVSVLSRMAWWQLVLICLPYGLIMALDTLGWRYAFADQPATYSKMLLARVAGEALNLVTALGSVGGEAVKVWLLRSSVSYEASVPSVIIAKTTSTIAQTLLLVVGLILAKTTVPVKGDVISGMLALLGLEALLVGGFLVTQLSGLVRRAGRLLFVLDIPAGVATATVIEAVGSGVRFATFLVPGSLGVLEGANTGLFVALGLGASAGLAFSLVRRARQAVWIGLGLLVLAGASLQAKTAEAAPRRAVP